MKAHFEVTMTRREYAELLPLEIGSQPIASGQVAGRALTSLISAGTELGFA